MEASIEYNQQPVFMNSVDIENIGDFAIEAIVEDLQACYYMIVQTVLGETSIYTAGPVVPDIDDFLSGYTLSVTKMDYNETKILKMINTFLNAPKNKCQVTKAQIVDIATACAGFKDFQTEIMRVR